MLRNSVCPLCGTWTNKTARMSACCKGRWPDTSSRWPVKRGKSCLRIRYSSRSRYLSHRSVFPFYTFGYIVQISSLIVLSLLEFVDFTGLDDDLWLECDESILTTRIESSCIFVGHNLDRSLKIACVFLISAVSLPASRCSHLGGEIIETL